jgi:hypothetical protein
LGTEVSAADGAPADLPVMRTLACSCSRVDLFTPYRMIYEREILPAHRERIG